MKGAAVAKQQESVQLKEKQEAELAAVLFKTRVVFYSVATAVLIYNLWNRKREGGGGLNEVQLQEGEHTYNLPEESKDWEEF
jgi:hypothetical protein